MSTLEFVFMLTSALLCGIIFYENNLSFRLDWLKKKEASKVICDAILDDGILRVRFLINVLNIGGC